MPWRSAKPVWELASWVARGPDALSTDVLSGDLQVFTTPVRAYTRHATKAHPGGWVANEREEHVVHTVHGHPRCAGRDSQLTSPQLTSPGRVLR